MQSPCRSCARQQLSFPACTRDVTIDNKSIYIHVSLSFPACTRDVTVTGRRRGKVSTFISRLHARCNGQAMTCQYRQRLYAFCANLISDNQPTAIFLGHCRCLIQVRASLCNSFSTRIPYAVPAKGKEWGNPHQKSRKIEIFKTPSTKNSLPFLCWFITNPSSACGCPHICR